MLEMYELNPIKDHSYRVGLLMANLMRYNDRDELYELYLRAGCYHDIGKLFTPSEILYKQGALSQEEKKIMKQHVMVSASLNQLMNMSKEIIQCSLLHHESNDGSGYPYGLKNNEIPHIAQVCKIADVFDALWEDRPYRKGLDLKEIYYIMDEMTISNKINFTLYNQFQQMLGDKNYVPKYINIPRSGDSSSRRISLL